MWPDIKKRGREDPIKCCHGCGLPPGTQQGDGFDMGQCTYTAPYALGGERCGTWYHLFCQTKAAGNGERCPLHGALAAAPPLPAVPKPAAKANLPEDPREQQRVHRLLREQLRGLDDSVARGDADPLGIQAEAREKVVERLKALERVLGLAGDYRKSK